MKVNAFFKLNWCVLIILSFSLPTTLSFADTNTSINKYKPQPIPITEEEYQNAKVSSKNTVAADWYSKGMSAMSLGTGADKEAAISSFRKAIELDPKNSDAYFMLGISYLLSGKTKQSDDMFQKAIKLDPGNSSKYVLLGIGYNAEGKYELAIACYGMAMKINPKDSSSYTNRGDTYLNMGEYLKAINDYDTGIKIIEGANIHAYDPSSPGTIGEVMNLTNGYAGRGNAYRMVGNFKQAIIDYTKAIEIFPDSELYADNYYLRSLAYSGLLNSQEALNDIDKAIQLRPKEPVFYYTRARHCQMFYLQKIASSKSNSEKEKFTQPFLTCSEDTRIAARLGHKESQEFLKSHGEKW